MVYEWKDGCRIGGLKAQDAGERIERIERKTGAVTAEAVVRDGQLKSSPFHGVFEWDDVRAAHLHRLAQARHIIRHIVVHRTVSGGERRSVRAFVTICEGEYEGIDAVMMVPDKRDALLSRARRDLQAFRARYEGLQELAAVFSAVDALGA